MNGIVQALRAAIEGTRYQGRVYLVGGVVRDTIIGRRPEDDIDLVVEGDAGELAKFLHKQGIGDHPPVTFPRFGTAALPLGEHRIEIVGARAESYDPASRKPDTRPASLLDDANRRDFTINTLLQDLNTGEILDLTGQALRDIEDRIIRTPAQPETTFQDDPLRMLRAIRFAARLGFNIDPDTYAAMRRCAPRLAIISAERIRDEFVKIVVSPRAAGGLEALRETGLLDQFAPELAATWGVTQNIYHLDDVWTHTLKMLESLPAEADTILRLAALLHDVGKPGTRSVDEHGAIHFYHHQSLGAEIARRMMRRLRFSGLQIDRVAFLISMHLRVGEYDSQWSDAAVRRLIRDAGDNLEDLITLTEADKAAANPDMPTADIPALRAHVVRVKARLGGRKIASPLDGREIIDLLGGRPGPKIGRVKEFLERQVIEGKLAPDDKQGAAELVLRRFSTSFRTD